MSEEINCVLITVCSRTDEYGFEMLKKSTGKFNWPFVTMRTEWKGFGTKLITTYQFLKSESAKDITHFFFCDAYDVVVLSTMEEALSKVGDKSKMLVGAERGLWPPDMQVYDARFEHFDHGFNYINSGLYFAPKELFIEYFEQNIPEYSTDDQKWLTETYLNQKSDNIILDNNCEVFQNYSFVREDDYQFGSRLGNIKTATLPVFVHGNGKTDLTRVYELINGKETARAVIPFGKTQYDSSILDDLYRVWGTSDGGTILSAYWDGELRMFKVDVPYYIIKELINSGNIGSLCGNNDWKEMDVFNLKQEIINPNMENKEKLSAGDITQLRETALRTAKELNPSHIQYAQALGQSGREAFSVTRVLQDADKIYEWLTKEI